MAVTGNSNAKALLKSTPKQQPEADTYGGRNRAYRVVVEMAAQAAGEIELCDLPAGAHFDGIEVITDTDPAAALGFGTSDDLAAFADPAVLGTAADEDGVTAGTVDQKHLIGKTSAFAAEQLSKQTTVFMTADAALPATGTMVITVKTLQP